MIISGETISIIALSLLGLALFWFITHPRKRTEEDTQYYENWHLWYAWYPIRMSSNKIIWLRYVERRNIFKGGFVDTWWEREYRFPETTDQLISKWKREREQYPQNSVEIDKKYSLLLKTGKYYTLPQTNRRF